ncbi:aldehyde dehydrogenase family protein [Jiangella asiatica]|uniref:Aldehyde dehydrogenase family protein n=1 Tax=Jiangella asiatica TaxID=2530372 RepID=A0A4R5DE95_9ACTN|nr:aldehyde dehydrogenase family protein [Jiangella asiatica]TDE12176.1 aldehyde dehydrogenase family protein [Jiangella asiatica]
MSVPGPDHVAADALLLVGGDWTPGTTGRTAFVENPAHRGAIAGTVPLADERDVDHAVTAAADAAPGWAAAHWSERGPALTRAADDLESQLEDVARLLALETGMAIRTQARPEVANAVGLLRYFGGVASQVAGDTVPLPGSMLSYTRREPWGVVAAIVPWNAPVSLSVLKLAPALAAGNAVVLKPALEAPLAVLAVARILAAHLPAGVLGVVTGTGDEAGAALVAHPAVRKVSLTGGVSTARVVLRELAERIVPATLELGGKSPSIVFPDADDDRTAAGVVAAMRFSRQGQSCAAGSRLLIHESVFDSFLARVVASLEALVVGDPFDETTDVGAVTTPDQFDRICAYVTDAMVQPGARLVTGGLPPTTGPLAEGYFAVPTIFAGTGPAWRVAREEIFGPVLVALPWRDEDEVVALANDTHFGLAAYIWSRDTAAAIRAAHRIDAGWIQINHGGGAFPGQSFGGYKQSGFGREYSLAGMLEAYTQTKNVTVNLA